MSDARARLRRLAIFATGGLALWLATQLVHADAQPAELVVHVPAHASALAVQRAIDEAVLVEHGLAQGLPWTDPYVRARIVAELRAGDPQAAASDDETLLARARQLGLAGVHPALRARIAAATQRQLDATVGVDAPDETTLRAYLHGHAERYARPTELDLVQVFVSAERHRDQLAAVAAALGERLAVDDAAPGDPSLLPRELIAATPARIDATFGPGIADAALAAIPGTWVGPLRGSYGMHRVRVDAHRPGGVPELATVIDRVRRDWMHDRLRSARALRLLALRDAYRITVRRSEPSP